MEESQEHVNFDFCGTASGTRTSKSEQVIYGNRRLCSDPNNESDPSSEYSLLGLTHVMNHCLGQKFIIWVKVNCLDMSLKPGNGIPRPRTVDESLFILLEMQHRQMGIPCIQNG